MSFSIVGVISPTVTDLEMRTRAVEHPEAEGVLVPGETCGSTKVGLPSCRLSLMRCNPKTRNHRDPESHTQIRDLEPLSEDGASLPRWSSVKKQKLRLPSCHLSFSMQPPNPKPPPNPTPKPESLNLTRDPESYSPNTALALSALTHEP